MSEPAATRLLVAEQLMLLAFSAGDGRLHSASRRHLPLGLAGAVLSELAINRSIRIDPRGSYAEKHLVVSLPSVTGDPLLDSMAAQILAQPPRTLAWWIKRLSRSGVQGQVASRLLASGLAVTARGVFTSHLQLTGPAAHADAAVRVRQTLLFGPAVAAAVWTSDPWSAALTSLAVGCRVVPGFGWLPRAQRRVAKTSLQVIRSNDPIGIAVAVLVQRAIASQAAASASSAAMITATGV